MMLLRSIFLSGLLLTLGFFPQVYAAFPANAENPEPESLSKTEFFQLKKGERFTIQDDIQYASAGGVKLLLDVYRPKLKGPLPAVMVVHGGAWRTGSKQQLAKYARDLAARGMVTFAINYRLSPKHKFPAQIDDCRAALKWIREHTKEYHVDGKRIGAIGYSAGGHLVALLGVTGKPGDPKHPETDTRLTVVCAGGAPCEFRDVRPNDAGLSFWLGGSPKQVPEQYQAASPMAFLSKSTPPMFFYNGKQDLLVKSQQAQAMSKALNNLGVETQFVLLDNFGHIITAVHPKALEKAYDFLGKHLKAPTP